MTLDSGLFRATDGVARCAWCAATPEYVAYHDEEWGFPVRDDRRLFEKLSLEGFQSGLSWLTILRKREAFRKAFANFEADKVARFTPKKVEQLLRQRRHHPASGQDRGDDQQCRAGGGPGG